MKIQSTTTRRIAPQQAPPKSEEPKEPWHEQAGDYLERSNEILTPKLAALGLGAKFAMKGNQITESLHPVAKAVGIVGGGLVGAFLGYHGGSMVEGVSSRISTAAFGEDTSLAKSIISVGLNSAAFGMVGGWTGAAMYGAFTVGGAAEIARQDVTKQG